MLTPLLLNYNLLDIITIAITIIFLVIASVMDIKTMRIPNYLTLSAFGTGLVLSFINCGWKTALIRLTVVVALFFVYMLHLLAGGDIKMLMALTMLQGPIAMLVSVIIGNLVLLGITAIRSPQMAADYIRSGLFFMNGVEYGVDKRKVPFSPYVLTGYILFLAGSILIQIVVH